jgi:hypothetical protein
MAEAAVGFSLALVRLEQGPDGHHRREVRDGGELADRQLAVDDPDQE